MGALISVAATAQTQALPPPDESSQARASAAGDEAPLPERIRLVTQEFPPFSYLEDGEVAGPARVLIDRACELIKVTCEHSLLPWGRAQALTRSGEFDGMYVIGFSEARSRWLYFSTPLLETEYGIFVAGDNHLLYAAPGDLQGYQVGVYGPSNTSRTLSLLRGEEPLFTVEMSPNNETGFRQLSVGRLDAVFSNREVGLAVMRRLGLTDIRYAGPVRKLDYYVGFSRQTLSREFNLAFSRAYQQLEARGTVRDVLMAHGILPGR
ncbi:ABC transporter substrate-binding protein [Motiliproteus sp. SC1-56]|uniref:substrate-binding periplasmic protein n=1 Tax=Motiliproteus sp. SC1-56 TaxID=2799565 RepID=UPI001A8C1946|nr:transporter substrate-binding domain-containing protein [Motiliproteus sp. SC1-56]